VFGPLSFYFALLGILSEEKLKEKKYNHVFLS
jgi:hypothetical protein